MFTSIQLRRAGLIVLAGVACSAAALRAQDVPSTLQTEIRFEGDREPVLQWGDRERLYFRTDRDAYVAILHIDTDGDTRLVYPRSPLDASYVVGGREHRLLFPRSATFNVREDPGVGYFFVIASSEPLLVNQLDYSNEVQDWDLRPVGRRVFTDPYEAIDRWVEFLIPDWEYVPYAVGIATYHVEERHQYPRFMCYGCHTDPGQVPPGYAEWNPYLLACTSFQVVSYSDPVFYPVTRYVGTNVVFVNPIWVGPRYGFERRDRGDEPTPYIATRMARPTQDRRVRPVRRPADMAMGSATSVRGPAAPAAATPVAATREPALRRTVPTVSGDARSGRSARPALVRRTETAASGRTVDLGVISGTVRRPSPASRQRSAEPRRDPSTVPGRALGPAARAGVRVRLGPTRAESDSRSPSRPAASRPSTTRAVVPSVIRRPAGAVQRATASGAGVRRVLPAPSPVVGPRRGSPARAPSVRTPTRGGSSGSVRRPVRSTRPGTVRRPTKNGSSTGVVRRKKKKGGG